MLAIMDVQCQIEFKIGMTTILKQRSTMNRSKRLALFLGSLLVLPTTSYALTEKFSDIDAKAALIFQEVNWNDLITIEIDLGDHTYSPSNMIMKRGTPYLMRLKNVGKYAHNMVGGTFFQAIVVKSVNSKDGRIEAPYLKSVYVRPKHQIELFFVPTRTGRFSYFCSINGHREEGMEGEIVIE